MSVVFDLFCGTGGFSYGFNKANESFVTRLGIDSLSVATETFRTNHKEATIITTDIRKLKKQTVSDILDLQRDEVDVIIGGPPCQGFSSIRPFRSSGEDDPRNSLFEEFASYVNFFRPKIFVIENVVGLATYKGGKTVALMEQCFKELGYNTEWRILNAAHYGVPQKRERFIMIGALSGIEIKFPRPTHYFGGKTIGFRDKSKMQTTIQKNLFSVEQSVSPAVTVMDAISDLPVVGSGEGSFIYEVEPLNPYQAARRKNSSQLTLHQSTDHSKRMLEIIRHSGKNIDCIPKHLITSGFSSCYSRLDGDEPSVTITVNFVHPASNRCIHPSQNRALTPREGARLQSFDDTFVFKGSRTQIVKQIGNAVPPELGKAIGFCVAEMLGYSK
jgi:DNA (cytosine-5)-methyltransferase 1